MIISENRYLQSFCLIVILLGIIRVISPRLAMTTDEKRICDSLKCYEDSLKNYEDSLKNMADSIEKSYKLSPKKNVIAKARSNDIPKPHRIISVKSYSEAFPDSQSVQEASARKWGVKPVQNREEAEHRKSELVYVGSNPFFFVEPLYWSIPYLVPKASVLLQDIGRNFIDSLHVKGLPAHKIIVTSVMRTKEEVARMKRFNGNVSENSCHMYGTTVDIAYNRYLKVEEDHPYSKEETVADFRLKQILSEVLADMRSRGRCWVKYEKKQSCFHLTVR